MPANQEPQPAAPDRAKRIREARRHRGMELLQQAANEHAFGDEPADPLFTFTPEDVDALSERIAELARLRKGGLKISMADVLAGTTRRGSSSEKTPEGKQPPTDPSKK